MTNQETVASRSDGDQPPDRLVDPPDRRRITNRILDHVVVHYGGEVIRNGPMMDAMMSDLTDLVLREREAAERRVAALEEGLRAMVAACEQDNLWQLEEALDKARSLLQSSAASQGDEE